MSETWRPVVGFETYYEVSDMGRVRSLDRLITRTGQATSYIKPGRMMSQSLDGKGYPRVVLSAGGECKQRFPHQLVLEAFVGPRGAGHVTRHRNGNPLDNRLSNLKYGTQSENNLDAVWHGTNGNTRKAKCAQGHEFAGDNVRTSKTPPGGVRRFCKACQRDNSRRYQARKKAIA